MRADDVKEHTRSHSDSACCIVGRPAMTHNTTLATVTRAQRVSDETSGGVTVPGSPVSLERCRFFFFFNLTRLHFNLRFGIGKQRRAAGALYGRDERDGGESRVTSGVKKQLAACGSYSGLTRPPSKQRRSDSSPLVSQETRRRSPAESPAGKMKHRRRLV